MLGEKIANATKDIEIPEVQVLKIPTKQIRWQMDADIPNLWKQWAIQQTDAPLKFWDIKTLSYFDPEVTPVTIRFYVMQFNLFLDFQDSQHQPKQIAQTVMCYRRITDPKLPDTDHMDAERINPLLLSVYIPDLASLQEDEFKVQETKIDCVAELKTEFNKQLEELVFQLVPIDATDLAVKVESKKQFVAEIQYFVQMYKYDKTPRYIIVCQLDGTIVGEASVSKTALTFKKLFKFK